MSPRGVCHTRRQGRSRKRVKHVTKEGMSQRGERREVEHVRQEGISRGGLKDVTKEGKEGG